MTPHQLELLHHTLGVRPDRREPHRNYFVAGAGHYAQVDLEALEADGMMFRKRTPAFCDESDVVFACTDSGRDYALDHLPPEPKRTKYGEYLNADCGDSFAKFLGIIKPDVEMRGYGSCREYRMCRRPRWVSGLGYDSGIVGEWATTIKAAKASYKAALKESKVPA